MYGDYGFRRGRVRTRDSLLAVIAGYVDGDDDEDDAVTCKEMILLISFE